MRSTFCPAAAAENEKASRIAARRRMGQFPLAEAYFGWSMSMYFHHPRITGWRR
jgi:hypothetical protein